MNCENCNEHIEYDLEGDLIHIHLDCKGVDARMCEPSNPNSKIAKVRRK